MWPVIEARESPDYIQTFLIPQVRQFDGTFSVKVYPLFADPEADAERLRRLT